MTKDEAIERIKLSIVFKDNECEGECSQLNSWECRLTEECVIEFSNNYERTETCKALFKED